VLIRQLCGPTRRRKRGATVPAGASRSGSPRLAAGEHSNLRHQAVLRLAEQHARADGTDAVVEVLAKDLTTAERYQRICDELVATGRIQPALEWARRGLDEFDERTDRGWNPGLPQLRRLAVTLYARLGRTAEAVELAWRDFVASPSVETYQRLQEQGIADGAWPGCVNASWPS
jgi:uncharacterized Zn finger protein